jgi:hypothetical protein
VQEETETEPDPRMMTSAEKHYEISNGEGAVTPARRLKQGRRIRNLAAERRQKKQERTCGSREFAAARRGIARCARVAWRMTHDA